MAHLAFRSRKHSQERSGELEGGPALKLQRKADSFEAGGVDFENR